MRTNTRLLAVTVLAGILAVPLGAAAETAAHEHTDKRQMHSEQAKSARGQRLDCRAMPQRDRTTVGCKWTAEKRPDFGAYRLMRQERSQRQAQVVFETRDRNRLHAIDEGVQRERDYVYFLEVRDIHGGVIGVSNPVRVSTRTRSEPAAAPLPARPPLPETPEPPALPAAPKVPGAPGVPATPGAPELPNLPEPPSLPALPALPSLPGL